MSVSSQQMQILGIVERCASALSLLGVVTIVVTFAVSPHFRNPIHRLALLNAFYNIFDVALTMISVSGPLAGNSSALCQLQGFLNQMFPLADVLWTLAMALDVFFVVFRRYDNNDLRRLELRYIAAITTFTFIPALVFLFIRTPDKGPMYGSVTLWCAIAPNWLVFRIAMYYAPIWASIFVTMILYVLVGAEILKRRRALKSVGSDSIPLESNIAASVNETGHNTAMVSRTVEVRIDSPQPWGDESLSTDAKEHSLGSRCSISTPPRSRQLPPGDGRNTARNSGEWHSYDYQEQPPQSPQPQQSSSRATELPRRRNTPLDRQSALSFRQYVVMPLMFFVVLLVVWVAPTTNRVASFANPSFSSFPLLVAVGAMGSLRGFWNGVVFVTIGMKGLKRHRRLERGIRSGLS